MYKLWNIKNTDNTLLKEEKKNIINTEEKEYGKNMIQKLQSTGPTTIKTYSQVCLLVSQRFFSFRPCKTTNTNIEEK